MSWWCVVELLFFVSKFGHFQIIFDYIFLAIFRIFPHSLVEWWCWNFPVEIEFILMDIEILILQINATMYIICI